MEKFVQLMRIKVRAVVFVCFGHCLGTGEGREAVSIQIEYTECPVFLENHDVRTHFQRINYSE